MGASLADASQNGEDLSEQEQEQEHLPGGLRCHLRLLYWHGALVFLNFKRRGAML